jgi:hypothetical protein
MNIGIGNTNVVVSDRNVGAGMERNAGHAKSTRLDVIDVDGVQSLAACDGAVHLDSVAIVVADAAAHDPEILDSHVLRVLDDDAVAKSSEDLGARPDNAWIGRHDNGRADRTGACDQKITRER